MTLQNEILILCNSNEDDNQASGWAEVFGKNLQTSVYQLFAEKLQYSIAHSSSADINTLIDKNKSIILVMDNIDKAENFKRITEIAAKKPTCLIFKQLITSLQLQQGIPDLQCYMFSDIDAETGIERFFNPQGNFNEARLYWAKILDIAFDIGSALFEPDVASENQKVVYLAESTPDEYENRDAVRSELIHRGYKVLPPHFLKGENEVTVKIIANYLEKSDISVHIVGNHYGENAEGSDSSLVEMQCRLAAKHWRVTTGKKNGKQFQRVVWIPPGLKPSDERQRRFVAMLRTEDKDAYSEIMQVPLEDLKTALREKIASIDQSAADKLNDKRSVYIIYEKKDLKQIQPLQSHLESNNIKPLYIDFSSNKESIVSTHFAYLTNSDSVVICDFDSSKQWINSKLKDLMKSPGFGRTKPFAFKAIYTKNVNRYKKLEEENQCNIIDANNDINNEFLSYLTKLNLQ